MPSITSTSRSWSHYGKKTYTSRLHKLGNTETYEGRRCVKSPDGYSQIIGYKIVTVFRISNKTAKYYCPAMSLPKHLVCCRPVFLDPAVYIKSLRSHTYCRNHCCLATSGLNSMRKKGDLYN